MLPAKRLGFGQRDEIDLVEDEQRDARKRELGQELLGGLDVLGLGRIGRVDDVEQEVGVGGFFERGPERGEQVLRQIADESDGVGDDDLALFGKSKPPRACVERGKELVLGEHVGIGERVEQRALAGVGVADDGDHRHVESAAPAARSLALLGQRLELRLEVGDALACAAATDFELRFTGAAPADAAGETRERVVFLPEPRERVFELGELDLQLAVARLGALGEDVENELRAIDDLEIGVLGDGRDLRRARGCDRR